MHAIVNLLFAFYKSVDAADTSTNAFGKGGGEGNRLRAIPCILMRGGSSKGPFLRTRDLPAEAAERDLLLLDMMGAGHELQIDGVGGSNPLSSKVAMVDVSSQVGVDVDYLFAQVGVEDRSVDTGPNCGNMLVGVAPFAVETGLVRATDPETCIRIRNLNTSTLVDAIIQTPGGKVSYEGTTRIDGVPGTAAPVKLSFVDGAGAKTGKLLPTGLPREELQGIDVTLIDMSVPVMMLAASSLGKTGYESPAELDADRAFFDRIERMRMEAGVRMGMGNVAASVLPKVILIAPPRAGGQISGRYLMPHSCHKSFAVTGGICLTAASLVPGTVAADHARWEAEAAVRQCHIEHPMGVTQLEVEQDGNGGFRRVSLVRTARKLFAGEIYVP